MGVKRAFKIRHFLLVTVFIYLLLVLIGQNSLLDGLNRRLETMEEAVRLEKEKQDDLVMEIELLNTSEYIEKVAREELGLVKPGEIKYHDITGGN
jgi:cell division protein FtsB